MDFLKPYGTLLLESFKEPVVIHHPKAHTIPRFGKQTPLNCNIWKIYANWLNALNMVGQHVTNTYYLYIYMYVYVSRWKEFGDDGKLPWEAAKRGYN